MLDQNAQISCLSTTNVGSFPPGLLLSSSLGSGKAAMMAPSAAHYPATQSKFTLPFNLSPLSVESLLGYSTMGATTATNAMVPQEDSHPSSSLHYKDHNVIFSGQVLHSGPGVAVPSPSPVAGAGHAGSMVRNQSADTVISSAGAPMNAFTSNHGVPISQEMLQALGISTTALDYPAGHAGLPLPCPTVELLGEASGHAFARGLPLSGVSNHRLVPQQGTMPCMTHPMTMPLAGVSAANSPVLNFSGPPISTPSHTVAAGPCLGVGGVSPLKRGDSADLQKLFASFMEEEEIILPFGGKISTPEVCAPKSANPDVALLQENNPGGDVGKRETQGVKRQERESSPQSPRPRRFKNKKRAVEADVGPKTPDNGVQMLGSSEGKGNGSDSGSPISSGVGAPSIERARAKPVAAPGPIKALLPAKTKLGFEEGFREVQCEYMFGKVVTSTDCGRLARIVLPRAEVEKFFPSCESRNGVTMQFWDTSGKFIEN